MRQFRKPENFRNFTEFANLISDFLRLLFTFLFAILTKFMVSSALIAKHSPRDFLVIVLTLLFSLLIPFPSLSDSLYLLSCYFSITFHYPFISWFFHNSYSLRFLFFLFRQISSHVCLRLFVLTDRFLSLLPVLTTFSLITIITLFFGFFLASLLSPSLSATKRMRRKVCYHYAH